MHSTTLITLLPLISFASADLIPARPIVQRSALDRSTGIGGWSLSSESCPSGTTGSEDENLVGSCCPSGTQIHGIGLNGGIVCCPDTADCSSALVAAPSCADPSWVLFESWLRDAYFCCLPGEVGAFESKLIDHGGICLPKGTQLSSTAMATMVGAMTTAAASSSGAASSASATAEATSATSAAATSAAAKATGAAGSVNVPIMGGSAVLGLAAWAVAFGV